MYDDWPLPCVARHVWGRITTAEMSTRQLTDTSPVTTPQGTRQGDTSSDGAAISSPRGRHRFDDVTRHNGRRPATVWRPEVLSIRKCERVYTTVLRVCCIQAFLPRMENDQSFVLINFIARPTNALIQKHVFQFATPWPSGTQACYFI